jgi:hypothetical protein
MNEVLVFKKILASSLENKEINDSNHIGRSEFTGTPLL